MYVKNRISCISSNPDIINGYCSVADSTANLLYGRYIIVSLVNFKFSVSPYLLCFVAHM